VSDPFFEHVTYLVASARDCLDEPLIYGPLRLVEGVSRLIEALPDDEFLQHQKRVIDAEKWEVMGDRDRFAAWLDELLRQFAAETKRRNLGAGA
jgi:Family of unknown function (DUF6092)